MSARSLRSNEVLLPVVALAVMTVALLLSPALSTGDLTTFSVFNLFQQLAWLSPLTLAFGLAMLVGEFDLSAAGIAMFAGIVAVEAGGSSPYVGALAAVAAGVLVGVAQGTVLVRLQISSVPVTLATYIALLGASGWVSGDRILSYDDTSVPLWLGQQTLFGVLSPGVLITLAVVGAVALVVGLTTWGRDARAIGSDRRASRAAGVRVDAVVIGVFAASGALAATSGVLLAYTTGSANPSADLQPLILGVVGALLGGATFKGGYGRVPGIVAGALTVCILQAIFAITAMADWLSQVLFAVLLLAVAALDAPDFARAVVRLRVRLEKGETA
jgi:ribose/xylose/arabinose/galactoside ABC-type transport system permease subunit